MKTSLLFLATRWLLCGSAWALCAAGAQANCVLDAPAAVVLGRYDPMASLPSVGNWSLTIRTQNPKIDCQARLQIETPDTTSNLVLQGRDPAGLRVSLTQDPGGNQPLAVAPQDIGSFKLDAGQRTELTLWALRGPGQWVSPGLYRGSVRVSLLNEQGQTLDRRDIDFHSVITPNVQARFGHMSAASGLNSTRLDFGELAQGARRSAGLTVQSNTGYTITLVSTQQGRLVNKSFAQAYVPYLLRLDGVPVSLSQASAGLDVARAGTQLHDIEIEIGPVQRVLAGEYADNLLITITAQ